MTALLLGGDARQLPLRSGSIQCVVTSPPYWGLRSYGTDPRVWGGDDGHAHELGAMERGKRKDILPEDVTTLQARVGTDERQNGAATNGGRFCPCGAWRGELGLEPTPELYVAHLVAVFREVRRVLRDDGTAWVILGDSYAHDGKWGGSTSGKHVGALHGGTGIGRQKVTTGLKPKDLVGIPWRVAFALQADGWWLRSDCIWAKPNPMPESITDRPTKAHEYLFLLAKRATYYYDAEAVKEPDSGQDHTRAVLVGQPSLEPSNGLRSPHRGIRTPEGRNGMGRNRRTVWTIATEPYPEAHFATFPEKLVEPCILAGTSERGACPACGAAWGRETERTTEVRPDFKGSRFDVGKTGARDGGDRTQPGERYAEITVGWSPACDCPPAEPVPCRVLDPFAGSGTTVAVAERLGRIGVGVELKPDYLRLARRRTAQAGLL